MRWTLVPIALLVALACPVRAPAAPDFTIRAGPHFRVLCHFDDADAAAAALETVEAAWPLASNLYGLADAPLDPPLDVHLYRRTADYIAAEQAISGGKFAKNLAFSSYDTRSSYVAVQPDLSDEALATIGITAQTRHNLAHEATHLVSYRASPTFRLHPTWVGEGAAMWVEEETLAARGWSARHDDDPYVSTKMSLAQRLLKGDRLPTASVVMHDGLIDMGMYDRYAVQSLLFRRLITRKDSAAFRAALLKAVRLEDGPDFPKRFFEAVTEPYATEGLDGLDLDFEQFVRSQTPAWDEAFRSLATSGDAWPQTAFGDTNALAWRTAPVGAETYEIHGQFEILPGVGKVQQMNVLLARDVDDGFLSVAFAAGYGVDVFRFFLKENRWEKVATGAAKSVQVWRRLPFRVAIDAGKITVRVDGTVVATADVKDRALSGAWGLGVQSGGAGVWRDVKLEGIKTR